MDALLTQRHVAQTIVDQEGEYVMRSSKTTSRDCEDDIELVFTLPPIGDRQDTVRTVDIGHGRIEQRNIDDQSRRWWATAIGLVWRTSLRSGVAPP